MPKTQTRNLRSKTLRSQIDMGAKKEVNSSSDEIKKIRKTAFKAPKSVKKKSSTNSSNRSISNESYVCSNVAKKVPSPTKSNQARNFKVKKDTSSNVCCYICSNEKPKRSLLCCQMCETKIHRNCLIVDEPAWKLKSDTYSWMCKQCRKKYCIKCFKEEPDMESYECCMCKIYIHVQCHQTYVAAIFFKRFSGLYLCALCKMVAIQNAQKRRALGQIHFKNLAPPSRFHDYTTKTPDMSCVSNLPSTSADKKDVVDRPVKSRDWKVDNSSDEDEPKLDPSLDYIFSYPYKSASDFMLRNFIRVYFKTPSPSPTPVDEVSADKVSADEVSADEVSVDKNDAVNDPAKSGSMSSSTSLSDKNVEDKELVKLGSISPVSSHSDKDFIDLKPAKSGSMSTSFSPFDKGPMVIEAVKSGFMSPSEKDVVVIESAKSGSMDSSSLQSNIGFKIKDNYPKPAKSDFMDSLPNDKVSIVEESSKAYSMGPLNSQFEKSPIVIEPAKSNSMDSLPFDKVPVVEGSSKSCSMEFFNPQAEKDPVDIEPAKSNSMNVLFSQSDKDPIIEFAKSGSRSPSCSQFNNDHVDLELAKSDSMSLSSSSSGKNPIVIEPGTSVNMSLSTSASDKDPVITDMVKSDFMGPSSSQSDNNPIVEDRSKYVPRSSLPSNKFLVVKDFAKSDLMGPSTSLIYTSSPKKDVVKTPINTSSDFSLCDTDFENSSFDSEESTESFETHPNAFTQNVEIPDCMDWSVHQLYQYLSDRGLSKLITDKIIENEIDGRALHLLKREDVTYHMGLKVGPALKLYKEIRILQTRSMHTCVYYE